MNRPYGFWTLRLNGEEEVGKMQQLQQLQHCVIQSKYPLGTIDHPLAPLLTDEEIDIEEQMSTAMKDT